MRKRRFIPENKDGVLVEISCRTIGGLAMLRPSRKLPEVIASTPATGRPLRAAAHSSWISTISAGKTPFRRSNARSDAGKTPGPPAGPPVGGPVFLSAARPWRQ